MGGIFLEASYWSTISECGKPKSRPLHGPPTLDYDRSIVSTVFLTHFEVADRRMFDRKAEHWVPTGGRPNMKLRGMLPQGFMDKIPGESEGLIFLQGPNETWTDRPDGRLGGKLRCASTHHPGVRSETGGRNPSSRNDPSGSCPGEGTP